MMQTLLEKSDDVERKKGERDKKSEDVKAQSKRNGNFGISESKELKIGKCWMLAN